MQKMNGIKLHQNITKKIKKLSFEKSKSRKVNVFLIPKNMEQKYDVRSDNS
jgi:hypothetical protein